MNIALHYNGFRSVIRYPLFQIHREKREKEAESGRREKRD